MNTTRCFALLMPVMGCVALMTESAQANSPQAMVEVGRDVTVTTTPECGDVESRVPAVGPYRDSLILRFTNFWTETSREATTASKHCGISADIRVPQGMMLRPVAAFADGEMQTSERGSARVALRYCVRDQGGPPEASQTFDANKDAAFLVQSPAYDDKVWSACSGPNASRFILDGYLDASATQGAQDGRISQVIIDNSEAQSVRWMWEWASCGFNGKAFNSSYQTAQGVWTGSTTTLEGAGGHYELVSGQTGAFYDVRYEDGGNLAKGFWRFENGSTGWFSFRLVSGGAEFRGEWGSGEHIGQNRKGIWKGW